MSIFNTLTFDYHELTGVWDGDYQVTDNGKVGELTGTLHDANMTDLEQLPEGLRKYDVQILITNTDLVSRDGSNTFNAVLIGGVLFHVVGNGKAINTIINHNEYTLTNYKEKDL